MNCANHPDRERSAFCQNCGKPVCSECIRNVGGSIFCEPCLTARVGVTAPPPVYSYPVAPGYPPAAPPIVGEPSPGVAALLGFIPGVGAMYNGQYAKGFIHLIVFAVLVSLASDVNGIFGLFVFCWIIYMAIEAHHTACARRDGTPLPNPFGLNDLSERLGFGKAWPGGTPTSTPTDATQVPPPASGAAPNTGPVVGYSDTFFHQAADGSQTYSAPGAYFHQAADGSQTYSAPGVPPVPPVPPMAPPADLHVPYYRRFPSGAIWLIVLGVIFMVGDNGFFRFVHHPIFWPIFLIGLGAWIFIHKMIVTGHGLENDGTEYYRWRFARACRGAFWVVLVGVIWLLDVLDILSWNRSWPLFLIAGGVMLLFKRTMHSEYGIPGYRSGGNGASAGPSGSAPPETTVPGSESVQGPSSSDSGNGLHGDEEGR